MSEAPGLHPLSRRLLSGDAWLRRLGLLLFLAALFLPGMLLGHNRYWLPLFSRYMALALFALSVDLVWGYTGLLTLGHGLYFAMGAYAVGYSLKLQRAALDAQKPFVAGPDMALPDFMSYCRLERVPAWIGPLIDIRLALVLAVVLPTIAAALFGAAVFSRRIKGVFFALVTQALVLAAFIFVRNQQPYTGGVVGMTYLARLKLFGHEFAGVSMYYLIAGVLAVCFVGCYLLVQSKFGKVLTAIRDNEYRVLALGYSTAMYKTFLFAFSGALAGLAGALYVSALGTTGPDSLGIDFSIEVVILVAVGGRGTLFGAVLGAVLVNFGKTYLNDMSKDIWKRIVEVMHWFTNRDIKIDTSQQIWPFILGGLFIVVVLFLPDGILGGLRRLGGWLARLWFAERAPVPAVSVPVPAPPPVSVRQAAEPVLDDVRRP